MFTVPDPEEEFFFLEAEAHKVIYTFLEEFPYLYVRESTEVGSDGQWQWFEYDPSQPGTYTPKDWQRVAVDLYGVADRLTFEAMTGTGSLEETFGEYAFDHPSFIPLCYELLASQVLVIPEAFESWGFEPGELVPYQSGEFEFFALILEFKGVNRKQFREAGRLARKVLESFPGLSFPICAVEGDEECAPYWILRTPDSERLSYLGEADLLGGLREVPEVLVGDEYPSEIIESEVFLQCLYSELVRKTVITPEVWNRVWGVASGRVLLFREPQDRQEVVKAWVREALE